MQLLKADIPMNVGFAFIAMVASVRIITGGNSPFSPFDSHASFELADPQLQIDLIAAEPQVEDPVAMAWNTDGSIFVVEMNDYPLAPAPGACAISSTRMATAFSRVPPCSLTTFVSRTA